MPEYSSTTITPADGVQVPSMNGSTSGNFLLSALRDYILASKGQANGLASLGSDGKLTPSQLPDLADDVIVVASYAVLPATGTAGKIYITADNNKMFRWDSDEADYVELSVDLSEYAKLTDLAAEESARETADTNLNNALTAIDHRVENLEQAKGSYVVQNYKDGSITPSGKGKWAVVEGLRGVSRVENQMIQNYNFADTSVWETSTGVGFSVSGNVATISYDTAYRGIYQRISISKGHKYLVRVDLKKVDADVGVQAIITDSSHFTLIIPTDNVGTSWTTCCAVVSTDAEIGTSFMYIRNGSSGYASAKSVQARNVVLTDLNIYFGTSDLSFLGATDSAKLATIQKDYPHLLTPSEYGVRIVDSSYSGVRAWGVNIFDEETESGYYNSTGNAEPSSSNIRSKNYIEVKGNTTYYTNQTIYVCQYDESKNFIGARDGVSGGATFTTLSDARYIRFNWPSTYGTTYLHDTQIAYNDSPAKTTYHAYHAPSTLSLTFQGKSAGSVSEMYYPETGEQTHPLKRITLDGTESWSGNFSSGIWVELDDLVHESDYIGKILASGGFITVNNYNTVKNTDYTISGYYDNTGTYPTRNFLYIRITSTENTPALVKTWLQNHPITVTYELVTPDPSTFVTPIIDNTLLTEACGRMSTVQTGTVVDGSFDMGFITL